jgi:hypothetical protein
MAILRIGSRVPDVGADMTEFLYGCPPWVPIKGTPDVQQLIESGQLPRIEKAESVPVHRVAPNQRGPQRLTPVGEPAVREAARGRRISG